MSKKRGRYIIKKESAANERLGDGERRHIYHVKGFYSRVRTTCFGT